MLSVGSEEYMLNIERLKQLRKEYNYKQADVADKLNVGRTTYAKYETGDIQPPVDQIVNLSNIFNVSTDFLLNKSDDPTPPNKKDAPLTMKGAQSFVAALIANGLLKPNEKLNEKQLEFIVDFFERTRNYVRFNIDDLKEQRNVGI
jgi:transcriptional regulator with XRE-family HTH domain